MTRQTPLAESTAGSMQLPQQSAWGLGLKKPIVYCRTKRRDSTQVRGNSGQVEVGTASQYLVESESDGLVTRGRWSGIGKAWRVVPC